MSEANGNSPSEHPEQPPPSERITELVLLRKLNNLADQRFEEIEFKRQILEAKRQILARLDLLEERVSAIPKRGEQ